MRTISIEYFTELFFFSLIHLKKKCSLQSFRNIINNFIIIYELIIFSTNTSPLDGKISEFSHKNFWIFNIGIKGDMKSR
jgi:hypothetical protein